MEESNKFYKLINQKLSSGKPELDPDFKQDLESRLIKEGLIKNNGNSRQWIYFGFLAIAILTIGWFYGNDIVTQITSKTEKNNYKTDINSNQKLTAEALPETNNIKSTDTQSQNNNDSKPVYLASTNKSDIIVNNKVEGLNSNPATKNSNTNNTPYIGESSGVKSNYESNSSENNNYASTNTKLNAALSTTTNSNFNSNTSSNTTSSTNYNKPADLNNTNSDNNSKDRFAFENDTFHSESLAAVFLTSPDAPSSSATEIANSPEETKDSIVKDSASIAPEIVAESPLDKGPVSFTMDLFAGPQLSTLQKIPAGNGTSEIDGTSSEVVFGINGNIYRQNFTLGLGLNYSQYSSSIATTYPYYHDSTVEIVPLHIETAFNILDIPLTVGYLFNFGKFSIQVEGGASMAFIVNTNSVIKLDLQNFELKNDSINPVSSYSNLIGQAGFLYSINNRLSCFLQPTVRYGLTGILKDDPSQKINTYSIRAGLRIKF